jgi:DNA-binding NtrC family response regulator
LRGIVEEKKRILVIDDDKSIREYLSRILEMEGYCTDTAGTGREALKKSKQHRYVLALINYRLPDMTSEQLQARMQARMPKLKIAVLGVTPIDPEKLIEILEERLTARS